MRKKLLTLCLAALCVLGAQAKKVYADLSADQTIGKGTWTASTNTFSWTASTNARMLLTGLTGDLSEYTSLVLETSDYTATWRVDFIAGGETISGVDGTKFYSAGTKTIDLQKTFSGKTDLLKSVTEVRVNTNSNAGSIVINKAYLVKPMTSLEFNNEGVATVDFTDLVASGVTFDESTGQMTSTGSGTLSLSLPATGVDMSNVARIMVEYDGDDITNYLVMSDASNEQVAKPYNSRYNLLFTDYQTKASNVAKMSWNISTSGTMTIKAIKFYNKTFCEKYVLTVSDAGASTLVLPYTVTIPEDVKAYTVAYSAGESVKATLLTGTIPANTPVLINAKAGDYDFVRAAGTDVPSIDNKLKTKDALNGQYYSKFYAPVGSYVLQNKDGKLGFYRVDTEGAQLVPPFRAYLTAEAAGAKQSLDIDFSGTTGIQSVGVSDNASQPRRHNLLGVEVSEQYKGIVIVNGKKVLVK